MCCLKAARLHSHRGTVSRRYPTGLPAVQNLSPAENVWHIIKHKLWRPQTIEQLTAYVRQDQDGIPLSLSFHSSQTLFVLYLVSFREKRGLVKLLPTIIIDDGVLRQMKD